MKYALFMIFGLLTPCLVKSQDTIPNRWIVKANATSWLNPYFPSVKMGLEKQVAKNLSISGEIGHHIINEVTQNADTFLVKSGGFSGNIECRYYLKYREKANKPMRNYVAINVFYASEQYNSCVAYINIGDTTYQSLREDNFTVDKKKWGVNFIYGKQRQFAKRWVVDAYIGLGLRYKTITNTDREYDKKKHQRAAVDLQFRYLDLSETSGINANFTTGVRIGFILK